ncbi:putative DNA excision repair complex component [Pyronema omphalodes]|nr:putative DNA excision repair complex component [Pyronema omphalodes]
MPPKRKSTASTPVSTNPSKRAKPTAAVTPARTNRTRKNDSPPTARASLLKKPPTENTTSAKNSTIKRTPKKVEHQDAVEGENDSTPRLRKRLVIPGYRDTTSESSLSSPEPESAATAITGANNYDDDNDDDDEEEEIWEDVVAPLVPAAVTPSAAIPAIPEGELQLTLNAPVAAAPLPGKKKGASLEERRIRILTHCIHVSYLLYHGRVRNQWCNDPEVQGLLLSQVTTGIIKDHERMAERLVEKEKEKRRRLKKEAKGKGKRSKEVEEDDGLGGLENTTDPILGPLGTVLHWWRKKFKVTAPGLRKLGYKSNQRLKAEGVAATEEGDAYTFHWGVGRKTVFARRGETIKGIRGFREAAEKLAGSRDVGAQLLTALLRALGYEARLVFSLQPLGFGFTAVEEASEDSPSKTPSKASNKEEEKTPVPKKRKRQPKNEPSDSELSELSEDEGGFLKTSTTKPKDKDPYDDDLRYPIFWTEIISPFSKKIIAVTAFPSVLIGSTPEVLAKFYPRSAAAVKAKQIMAYTISYSSDLSAKDVTLRYHPSKKNTFRLPPQQVPYSDIMFDWFLSALQPYLKPKGDWTALDFKEASELEPPELEAKPQHNTTSISGFKNHPDLILERHLKREEAIRPGCEHVQTFTSGKGAKQVTEKVFRRSDVVLCKTVENWYREGRVLIPGAQALKQVKRRAVTLTRKREIEEKTRAGEEALQGLYSLDQTQLYDPPPIEDGVIPKNGFGNIDLYVPTMLPPGAVHIPLKGTARVAKKLGIDYAEAVVGFEFRQQRAVPEIQGIVVAEENEELVRDAWHEEEQERRRKEDTKREKDTLARWRRFLLKARVLKKLRAEWEASHGAEMEKVDVNPFVRKGATAEKAKVPEEISKANLENTAAYGGGGFVPNGQEEEEDKLVWDAEEQEAGGFLAEDEEQEPGGFMLEDDEQEMPPHEAEGEGGGGFLVEIIEDDDNEPTNTKPSTLPVPGRGMMSLRDMLDASNTPAAPEEEEEEQEESEEEQISPYFNTKKTPNRAKGATSTRVRRAVKAGTYSEEADEEAEDDFDE